MPLVRTYRKRPDEVQAIQLGEDGWGIQNTAELLRSIDIDVVELDSALYIRYNGASYVAEYGSYIAYDEVDNKLIGVMTSSQFENRYKEVD